MVFDAHHFPKTMMWSRGNGDSTHFWLDNWLMDVGRLTDYALLDIPVDWKNHVVTDYVKNGT